MRRISFRIPGIPPIAAERLKPGASNPLISMPAGGLDLLQPTAEKSVAKERRFARLVRVQAEIAAAASELPRAIAVAARSARELTRAGHAAIQWAGSDALRIDARGGAAAAHPGDRQMLDGALVRCLRTCEIVRVEDGHEGTTTRSMVAVPLESWRGQPGALEVSSDRPNAFGEEEVEVLRMIAGFLGATVKQSSESDEHRLAARDRSEAMVALAQRADELMRANAELEEFVYMASHDLQEPLRMVVGYVTLLAQRYRGKLGPDADEFIKNAVEGSARMQDLISALLDYSRLGEGARVFEPTDSRAALESALADLAFAIAESGAHISYDRLPMVMADGAQLCQLFQNLVGNSLKFRAASPPQVSIAALRQGGYWQFSVRDNGIGIDQAHIPRIFAIFQRLHRRAEYPGNGIGLAICKRIVEHHGGRIWAESEPGKGSTFYFTMPAEDPIATPPLRQEKSQDEL